MQTERFPYELLVRWDRSGRLAGAHAQFRYVTSGPDGAVIAEALGGAEPLGLAGNVGFPLADVLSQAQAAALSALETVTAERDALAARLSSMMPSGEVGNTG